MEKVWSRLESNDPVPLFETAFSMTIKGITRCLFGESFKDQKLVDRFSAVYISAWTEMEVLIIYVSIYKLFVLFHFLLIFWLT